MSLTPSTARAPERNTPQQPSAVRGNFYPKPGTKSGGIVLFAALEVATWVGPEQTGGCRAHDGLCRSA